MSERFRQPRQVAYDGGLAKITIKSRIDGRHQKSTGVACQVSIRTPHSLALSLGNHRISLASNVKKEAWIAFNRDDQIGLGWD